jgi:hypothetical protein
MDPKDLLKKLIPNPLDSESTLPGLLKQADVAVETVSFVGIIRNIVFLAIAGFVLSSFLQVPSNVVGVLIGFEILSSLLIAYTKYRKVRSLSSITPAADGISLKRIVVTREYYSLITGTFALTTSAISVGLIFFLFGHQLSNLSIQNEVIQDLALKYLILLFVVFRLFNLIVKLIRYRLFRGVKENENVAQVNQSLSLVKKKLGLIASVPGMSVTLVVLFLIRVPGYVVSTFAGILALLVVSSLIELRRIGKVDLSVQASVANLRNITLRPGEKIVGTLFGIMNRKRRGVAFLGVGKTTKPENALLITDSRLLFVEIPIAGGNKIVDGTTYSDMNFFWNRGEIREKGQRMVESMSLEEIAKQYGVIQVPFDDIAKLNLGKMEFTVSTNTNQKHSYLYMDREYVEPLKQWLRAQLWDKFVETD